MSENLLAQQTSPYLRLHKDNPVDWRPWGPEALAEAQQKNKPILLSIGYTACHWCHVMNHESFADPEVGALMNELFVNIKVDREERPDIDQIYQTASVHMGHSGGWPLTMFLTPDGKPYFAAGYMPPQSMAGRRSFKDALREADRVYRDDQALVGRTTTTVQGSLASIWERDMRTTGLPPATIDFLTIHTGQAFDIFYGGIIGAPKFPNVTQTEFLWRGYLRTGAGQLAQLVRTAVDAMALGGLYDHVGGGFHRYSTDERWLVPHFEKMLYDNALLVELYTLIWQENRFKLYADRVEETIGWMLREMRSGGGFASAIDADSEGEEGRYYIWSEPEIDAALAGTFSQRFKQIYNVSHTGSFRGHNILHRLANSTYPQSEADEALFKKQLGLLLAARQKRVAPLRDGKVLTDCNAMAVAALARAASAFRRPEWLKEAIETFDFIVETASEGERLFHSTSDGRRGHAGFSDDYAQMARAAFVLHETTGESRYLELAMKWVDFLNEHFWDREKGGYYTTSDDAVPLFSRPRMASDQGTPSANGVMVQVLANLYYATGKTQYGDRVQAQLQAFSAELGNRYMSYGAYMCGLDTVMSGLQIVIVGPPGHARTQELISAVNGRSLPARTLVLADPGETYADTHPAFGKTMQAGTPTAYVCIQQNCSAPITSPVALSQMLQLPVRQAAVAGRA
jgi:hypothetical protein